MKKQSFLLLFLTLNFTSFAQKYFTKSGKVHFLSDTPLEKIEANNTAAMSVIDMTNGNIEFGILVKSFHFEKALMEEHFNENYMESTKYPKATFKGKIENLSSVNLSKAGSYKVKISGTLTIHGVTKPVNTEGNIGVKDGKITSGTCSFSIKSEDYQINIPSLVKEKIAKSILININANYVLM
jgi:polyisoprenoid-binding protein YceI